MPATRTTRPLDLLLAMLGAGLALLILRQAIGGSEARRADIMAALQADPLNEAGLAARGLALARAGRDDLAAPILTFAGELDWRDPQVQAWLLASTLREGLWPEALEHADALLRTDEEGRLRPILFPAFNQMIASEPARAALLVRLEARHNPWRTQWLAQLGAADVPGADTVFEALANSRAPLRPWEYDSYINGLVGQSRFSQAYRAWRVVARRRGEAALRDGHFEGPWDGSPFTWSPASGVGAASGTEAAGAGIPGQALRVDYDGASRPGFPGQLLALGPGAWRLSWLERGQGAVRLAWRVRCAEAGSALATARPAGSSSWTIRRLAFVVPTAGCTAQWLELAPDPGERRDDATSWYADMTLARTAEA